MPRRFFARDPRKVAPELLGKVLVRKIGGQLLAGRIVEVEAYLGLDDPAAHAAAGPTARNRVLFGRPGHAYVYFIYGNYYCLNVSCQPAGQAGCVLLRALEPLAGVRAMARRRGLHPRNSDAAQKSLRLLTSGPGRLCQALGITRRRDNGADLTSASASLWLADDGFRPRRVLTTPRIGITKAEEHPLRYLVAGNEFVSGGKTRENRAGRKRRRKSGNSA